MKILKKHFTILSKFYAGYYYQFGRKYYTTNEKSSETKRLVYPSASRNSAPIFEALRSHVDQKTNNLQFLEIASGSGQHLFYFASRLPNITFQPTEYDRTLMESISAYAAECFSKNIHQPVYVDITKDVNDWKEAKFELDSFDYMYCCNMVHIAPWICAIGLFNAAGKLLKPHGLLFTYGPFAVDGKLTPESNVNFDLLLRSRNSEWGVRDIVELKKLAEQNGMALKDTQEMPSNNKFLTWIKK